MAERSRYHGGQPWWGEPDGIPGDGNPHRDQRRSEPPSPSWPDDRDSYRRIPRWSDYGWGYAGDYSKDFGPYGTGPYPPLGPRGYYGSSQPNPQPMYAYPRYPHVGPEAYYGDERSWWDRTRDELASWVATKRPRAVARSMNVQVRAMQVSGQKATSGPTRGSAKTPTTVSPTLG